MLWTIREKRRRKVNCQEFIFHKKNSQPNYSLQRSSIFKMLSGETMISDGKIFTSGYNHKYQMHRIYRLIGYCPQFDALFSDLTCRETLEIFAILRGIPIKDVKNYVEHYARNLDFIQYIDKRTTQLR